MTKFEDKLDALFGRTLSVSIVQCRIRKLSLIFISKNCSLTFSRKS